MDSRSPRRHRAAPAALGLGALGVALVAFGVAGFVPGVTADIGGLRLAGFASRAEVLGLVQTSVVVNLLHLTSGALALAFAVRGRAPVRALLGLAVFLNRTGRDVRTVLWSDQPASELARPQSAQARTGSDAEVELEQQDVIVQVIGRGEGRPELQVEKLLMAAFGERQLAVPPHPWVRAVAVEFAAGHVYVVGDGTVSSDYVAGRHPSGPGEDVPGHELRPSPQARRDVEERGRPPGNQLS